MNADVLLKHFARIAEAPHAVSRLRQFVLDLAVRGRLVEQSAKKNLNDDLLKRVQDASIVGAESCFPSDWIRTKVGDVLDFRYGKGLKANERAQEGPVPVFGSNGIVAFTDKSLTDEPSIIVGRKGSAGALNLCTEPSWTTDVAYFVECPSFFDIRYLFFTLQTLNLNQLGKGVKPGLSRSDAYALAIPIPPLTEQHRIVAKVDELMALCDQLEAAKNEREACRDRLVAASLHRVGTAAATAPEAGAAAAEQEAHATPFPEAVRFHLTHLSRLTTRPEHIKQLRQTILNLAVRGMLVAQDPSDDRRNQRALRPDEDAEGYDKRSFDERAAQFVRPASWAIEPLSRVTEHIVDCPHTTPIWTEAGVLCIRTNQVRAGALDLASPYFVSEETYRVRIERLEPRCDDILYIREGGVLGVGCRVPSSIRLCLGQRLMLIRANNSVSPRFLELCLNSPWITDFAARKTTGGAAPRVNMSIVRGYPIPVPPRSEQDRIVAKVDELMHLCDQIEAQLNQTQADSRRMLEAVLRESLQVSAKLEEA